MAHENATPRPWICEEGPHWLTVTTPTGPIENGQRSPIAGTRWSGEVSEIERANTALIVEAVNAYDTLRAENERLRSALEAIADNLKLVPDPLDEGRSTIAVDRWAAFEMSDYARGALSEAQP